MSIRKPLGKIVNSVLRPLGVKVVPSDPFSRSFITARHTIAAARKRNLSVPQYVSELWNNPGGVATVLGHMEALGVFSPCPEVVCEIGPGTGQFLDAVVKRCPPKRYEIYETAADWRRWLKKQYRVVDHHCSGSSLSETGSDSVDLVHAHGVFVYTPFLVTVSYFKEIARVLKPGGCAVFDICCEHCFGDQDLENWLHSEEWYPAFLGHSFVEDTFRSRGFMDLGDFPAKFGQGRSHYLAFRKASITG